MAKPIDGAALRGFGKSLAFAGKVFPVGPQVATLKPFSDLKLPINGTAVQVRDAGTVIDGYDLRGHDLVILADNVKIRNSLLNPIGYHTVNNMSGRGLVVELNLFDGEKAKRLQENAAGKPIAHSDFIYSEAADTIARNNIVLDTPSDAFNMVGGWMQRNALVGACYIPGAHSDAISVHKTFGPMEISENYIDFRKASDSVQGPNSCVKIVSHFGAIQNVRVVVNVLLGGGFNSYVGDGGRGAPDKVTLTDNLMGLTEYGDKEGQFIAGGDHGTNFVMGRNALFSGVPDGQFSVVGSQAPAPAPTPAPVPPPAPAPAGRTYTEQQVTDLKAALVAMAKILG